MSTNLRTNSNKSVFIDLDGYDRIRAHTPDRINRKIQDEIESSVRDIGADRVEPLSRRIEALDREWDVDRATMVMFAGLAGLVSILAATRNRKWLRLHAIQFPFLAYHAAVGWCPPMAVLRRLGFRSAKEIDAEKYALKTLRGDFQHTDSGVRSADDIRMG